MITESVLVSYHPLTSDTIRYNSVTVIAVGAGLYLIFDRTYADVVNKTAKGFYNATDLNRVGDAVKIIASALCNIGIKITLAPKTDWVMDDTPTPGQMEKYLDDIRALLDILAEYRTPRAIPAVMSGLTVVEANAIEKALDTLYSAIGNILRSSRYHSGVTISGVNAL